MHTVTQPHSTMTIHTIYQHFVTANALVHFQLKSVKKFKSNISKITSDQDNFEETPISHETQHENELNDIPT